MTLEKSRQEQKQTEEDQRPFSHRLRKDLRSLAQTYMVLKVSCRGTELVAAGIKS